MLDKNLKIVKYIDYKTVLISVLWSNLSIIPNNNNFATLIFNDKEYFIKFYHVKMFSAFLTMGSIALNIYGM
jgi:hypothetical protein